MKSLLMLTIIGVMLSLMIVGFVGLFNLADGFSQALDTSFKWNFDGFGEIMATFWSIIFRIIVAPAMIIVPAWIIYKVVTEL